MRHWFPASSVKVTYIWASGESETLASNTNPYSSPGRIKTTDSPRSGDIPSIPWMLTSPYLPTLVAGPPTAEELFFKRQRTSRMGREELLITRAKWKNSPGAGSPYSVSSSVGASHSQTPRVPGLKITVVWRHDGFAPRRGSFLALRPDARVQDSPGRSSALRPHVAMRGSRARTVGSEVLGCRRIPTNRSRRGYAGHVR